MKTCPLITDNKDEIVESVWRELESNVKESVIENIVNDPKRAPGELVRIIWSQGFADCMRMYECGALVPMGRNGQN